MTVSYSSETHVRLDKWLWAARFFKTRSLATEAINGGKVHVNNARAKPARAVRVGETLSIRRGPYEYTVVVRELSDRRGPASEAVKLYEETQDSIKQRQNLAEAHKLNAASAPRPARRPNKKDRRRIIQFTKWD